MVWLLVWCGIGLLFVGMLVGCGWVLWRKGRALYQELRSQGRTVTALIATLDRLGLAADRTAAADDPTR